MSEVWAEKYRPSMDEIVGQDDILREVESLQHFIFHSQKAGTGKTSLAHAMAKELDWPIHVFNASSKATRGIEFVEEQLLPMSRTGVKQQFFLLDEADQLTPAAQSALKGVIENAHGFFILTCNDLSKLSDYLKSRCYVCNFNPINDEDMLTRLSIIAGKEGVKVSKPQMGLIIKAHQGDLRNAVGALQVYASMDEQSSEKFLLSLSGNGVPAKEFLYHAFTDSNFDYCLDILKPFNPRVAVKEIFAAGMESRQGQNKNKLKLLDAAVTAERDFLMGVDEGIALANFVGMCIA